MRTCGQVFVWAAIAAFAASCSGGGGGARGFGASIHGPVSPAYTNGTLTFQVDVTGNPDSVRLMKDGVLLTELPYPWLWAWDTSTIAEGTYAITAVATKGTESKTSAAVSVVIDRTAPVIVSQFPLPGAADVLLSASGMSVTLSEPIDVRTLSKATLSAGNVTTQATTLSADGKTISIPFTSLNAFPMTLPATGVASLGDVTDLAGNPVAAGTWNWTFPDWLRLSATNRVPSADAASAAIAVDGSGSPVVAWEEGASGARDILASRWDGTQWVALGGALDESAADDVTGAAIAIDFDGAPVVAWLEGAAPAAAPTRLLAKKWNGSGWTALGSTLNVTSGAASEVTMGFDAATSRPMLGWNEGGMVHVAELSGVAWSELGSGISGRARGSWLSGTVAPFVAVHAPGGSIVGYQWGGSWSQLGSPLTTDGKDDIAVSWADPFGSGTPLPWMVYFETDGAGSYAMQSNFFQGDWQNFGILPPGGGLNATHFALIGIPAPGVSGPVPAATPAPQPPNFGGVLFAWEEAGDVKVSELNGFNFAWTAFGETVDVTDSDPAGRPSLFHGDAGTFIAWHENGGTLAVHAGKMNTP